ncbi:GL13643 [Drosophila persimilis]|uniref:GL13643 n=1 Tax=Drosophila persimilis TaxID=7234 RepID=B4GPB2_DROPE|nr:GL13643 [Drosophila persimilis]
MSRRNSSLTEGLYIRLVSLLSRSPQLRTIFYYNPAGSECHLEEYLRPGAASDIPLFIWRSVRTVVQLNGLLNEGLLVLACLPGVHREDLLRGLSNSLRYLRQAWLLIELAANHDDDKLVAKVLEFCLRMEMINADVVLSNFEETRIVYGFDAYPRLSLRKHFFGSDSAISNLYPDKVMNLNGYQLRTMPDLSEPNTLLYYDQQGRAQILGYVWNMLVEFASKHNAHLQMIGQPVQGKTLSHIQMLDLASDGRVDVAASVQPISMRYLDRYHEYAYPVHCASWCTMLPTERELEISEVFSWTVPAKTFTLLLLLWLLHEFLRGRWLRHRRLQALGWLILVTLLTANYQGRLLSLLVSAPTDPPIDSFQALAKTKLHIFGVRSEYAAYDFDMRTRFASIFRLSNLASELIQLRNSLNTSFAYTVTNTKWQLYAEQQSHSSRPLFRYSTDLCYYEMVPFALVIPENSPHRPTLHHFMLQLGESGLFDHWVDRSFYYMVQAGRLHIRDLSEGRHIQSLSGEDLANLFLCYGACVLISLWVFVCEQLVPLAKSWLGF